MKTVKRNSLMTVVALGFGLSALAGASPFVSVCDRIPVVRESILLYLPSTQSARRLQCDQVTENDLAQIDNFGGVRFTLAGANGLRSVDLQGLTNLSYLSVSGSSSAKPSEVPDLLFSEVPNLKSLSVHTPAALHFSEHSLEGLAQLKSLEISAASVNLTRKMLENLSSLESVSLELKILPDELRGKVVDTPVHFERSELAPTGIFAGASALRELTVAVMTPPPSEIAFDPHFSFVLVAPGKFIMGSPQSESGSGGINHEEPHEVTLTKVFEIQTTEVTQSLWEKVMGHNPSARRGQDLPVTNVSYSDINRDWTGFLARLNEMRRGKGYLYRLPTEAEWEYAARAGSSTRYSFGDAARQLGGFAWLVNNSSGAPHPVGTRMPNALGIFDMMGNVSEWVQDTYWPLPSTPQTDPLHQDSAGYEVIRGGSWRDDERYLRCASRQAFGYRDPTDSTIGFRLVRIKQ